MLRISDPGMMEAANKIADAQPALGRGSQGQPPAAVDPFIRYVIAVYDSIRPALFQSPDRSGDVAHVVAADDVVLIADSVGPLVAVRQQYARNLEPTYRKNQVSCACAE